MMRSIKKQEHHKTEPSFFNADGMKQLPIVYSACCANYCSLRVKKKFIDRYLMTKQISQNCRNDQNNTKDKFTHRQINSQQEFPFKVSPSKIHLNSPELAKERIKTDYPKVRIFRHQKRNNQKSIFKTITVDFLDKRKAIQAERNKFLISKAASSQKEKLANKMIRPMTASSHFKSRIESVNLRRTKTVQVTNLVKSTNGKEEGHYTLNGWENQVPEYDN